MRGSLETPSIARPARLAKVVRLALLDGFELRLDELPMPLPLNAQRLLAFLALHDRPLMRAFVAGSLWPDATERHAGANLRSTLWRLRRCCSNLVEAGKSHLQLSRAVSIDFREAIAAANRLASSGILDVNEEDRNILSWDLLPDWYEEWVNLERERFRQLRVHGLETLCRRLTDSERYGDAVQAGLAAVAAEPLRESAHRLLIEAHAAEGNLVEARRQYDWLRRLLLRELGEEPSETLDGIVRRWSTRLGKGAGLQSGRSWPSRQQGYGRSNT